MIVMEDLVVTFLLLLLQIWYKSQNSQYRSDLATGVIQLPKRGLDGPPLQVNDKPDFFVVVYGLSLSLLYSVLLTTIVPFAEL